MAEMRAFRGFRTRELAVLSANDDVSLDRRGEECCDDARAMRFGSEYECVVVRERDEER